MFSGESANRHRPPRMRDKRQTLGVLVIEDETRRRLDLSRGIVNTAKRRLPLGWLIHLTIAIGIAESVKIESPNIKSRVVQCIPPGKAVESMRYRKRRWKGGAVHVQNETPLRDDGM
jgi:hypothetical protein